mmetsp:Transcript_5160/g.8918  ORF Transcript_5160/g.8918 Transcript_5160/m.8918 type:complete len:293 (-) Transcript_5160:712-1590(-)
MNTDTKIFVGGLAWETESDSLRKHFQSYGEITEAVVIKDKLSGKSKGYGFVTFATADAAARAVANATPEIDGRRTNCNLASQGQKNRPQRSSGGFGGGYQSGGSYGGGYGSAQSGAGQYSQSGYQGGSSAASGYYGAPAASQGYGAPSSVGGYGQGSYGGQQGYGQAGGYSDQTSYGQGTTGYGQYGASGYGQGQGLAGYSPQQSQYPAAQPQTAFPQQSTTQATMAGYGMQQAPATTGFGQQAPSATAGYGQTAATGYGQQQFAGGYPSQVPQTGGYGGYGQTQGYYGGQK